MKTFFAILAASILVAIIAYGPAVASGRTEPRIEPEPGFNGTPLLHCKGDPGRTFRYEHQRRAECGNHEQEPREPECTNLWVPGVMLAVRQKECAANA